MYGDIAVEMLSEKDKEDWTIREFKLSLVRKGGGGVLIATTEELNGYIQDFESGKAFE